MLGEVRKEKALAKVSLQGRGRTRDRPRRPRSGRGCFATSSGDIREAGNIGAIEYVEAAEPRVEVAPADAGLTVRFAERRRRARARASPSTCPEAAILDADPRAGRPARRSAADVSDDPRHRDERQDARPPGSPPRSRARTGSRRVCSPRRTSIAVTERLPVCGVDISEKEFGEEYEHLLPFLELVDARSDGRHLLRGAHRARVPVVRRQAGRPSACSRSAWAARGTRRTSSRATSR